MHEAQRLRARMGGDVRAGVRCTEHDAAGVLAMCCNAVQYSTIQYSTVQYIGKNIAFSSPYVASRVASPHPKPHTLGWVLLGESQ